MFYVFYNDIVRCKACEKEIFPGRDWVYFTGEYLGRDAGEVYCGDCRGAAENEISRSAPKVGCSVCGKEYGINSECRCTGSVLKRGGYVLIALCLVAFVAVWIIGLSSLLVALR